MIQFQHILIERKPVAILKVAAAGSSLAEINGAVIARRHNL